MVCSNVFISVILVAFFGCLRGAILNEPFIVDSNSVRSNFIYPKDQQDTLSFFIIGGAQAVPHYFPYVAAIEVKRFNNFSFFCAGTLISTRWVLTAAHCLDKTNYTTLYFGRHNLSVAESSQINMVSNQFVIHEKWNETLLINDIGLIYLPQEITLSDEIKTVEIASGNESYANVTAFSMGWGMTNLGTQSDVLRYIDVKILENSICKETYRLYTNTVQSSHICTSGDGFIGTCKGDSGGPLIYQNKQIGLSSFGYTSCYAEKPSVYTRLTNYTEWLKEKTNIDFNSTEDGASNSKSLKHGILGAEVLLILLGYFLTWI